MAQIFPEKNRYFMINKIYAHLPVLLIIIYFMWLQIIHKSLQSGIIIILYPLKQSKIQIQSEVSVLRQIIRIY